MNIDRDENRRVVGAAKEDGGSNSIVPLKVDPNTGRLLIEIHATSQGSPSGSGRDIDGNFEESSAGVDSSDNIEGLTIDPNNGYLKIDNN